MSILYLAVSGVSNCGAGTAAYNSRSNSDIRNAATSCLFSVISETSAIDPDLEVLGHGRMEYV